MQTIKSGGRPLEFALIDGVIEVGGEPIAVVHPKIRPTSYEWLYILIDWANVLPELDAKVIKLEARARELEAHIKESAAELLKGLDHEEGT